MTALAQIDAVALDSLAHAIRAEHEACEHDARAAVEHAIRCGELLVEAKAGLRHGEWLLWLAENFPAHRDTASNYMRLASNSERVRNLDVPTVRSALAELAKPRAVSTSDAGSATPSAPPAEGFGSEDGWSPTAPDGSGGDEPEVVDAEVVPDDPEPSSADPGPRVQCPSCGHMVKPSDIEERSR